ncbi:ribosomal large subunit pseudouridine synthase A [Idiomarina fontislapidosi]|uniref:Dual-specificity RNA pseudouridine synthase RluA n=1 Tax=Idiomarina fontislapidosi TaxID=263723 RepID=A0A432Y891_9GAMM|nr:pseudouridine synthase [Idiomarina fontislapidosi]PYE33764.1 ribosomal large subunit pseudouridine synthase A [Idiomarina fontislapidosi]RUO57163.1 RNA pseudouridine synthase [Idiomarina fontislapidosi]|tara:strand:- start:1755 stop:2414 length:660 start_codon:yes stop_codon:yes gene_type:complete
MALLNYQPPTRPYLKIIYRDDAVVVVDKPAGLLSVPGKAVEHRDSVYTRLARVFPDIRVVHRLDMATSGVMIFAIGKPAQSHLSRQFQQRTTKKTYLAKVWGRLPGASGCIDLPLSCDWPNRPKQHVDFFNGKASQTGYQVIDSGPQSSTVKLFPYTGRSHQLRVHMLALECPILGDKFYAHPVAFEAADRLLLHAFELKVISPLTEQPCVFTSPCPFT